MNQCLPGVRLIASITVPLSTTFYTIIFHPKPLPPPFSFTVNSIFMSPIYIKSPFSTNISFFYYLFSCCVWCCVFVSPVGGNSMPTPVSTAKQCLNPEASHALEEAVAVARRRRHAQTTSLHAVSAILSLTPSPLKEACVRAKNVAFYPKVQLKALDFCLSVSLDRLPISQSCVDEPKISNSLMAAIKRSQANQRRHPDSLITIKNSQLGHGQNQQESLGCSSSGVKVELQHLIVSILDDPIVSRVFNDAGFSSFDVKLALFRPFQRFYRYPPNVFGVVPDPVSSRFRFPFPGFGDEEGDYRRIGEVLARRKGRNPLLVGVGANDVLKGFVEVLQRRKEGGFLPLEMHGTSVLCIEKDVLKFVNENWSHEAVSSRFREVDLMVQQCLGPGLMISFGNLICFLKGDNSGFLMNLVNFVVQKLTKLLEVHDNRVWLIGSAANDQMYMEFLHRFPSVDKDWDLQPLPIMSARPWLGESCFKSSLMGSFVPLGGFFLSPDVKGSCSSSYQHDTQSKMCSPKTQEGIIPVTSRGCLASVTDDLYSPIPPWLQIAQCEASNMINNLKAKDRQVLVSAPTAALQSKGGNLSNCWDHLQSSDKREVCQEPFRPRTDVGSHNLSEKVKNINNEKSCVTTGSCKECDYGRIHSNTSMHFQEHLVSMSSKPVLQRSFKNGLFLANLSKNSCNLCVSAGDDGQTSSSSIVSVTTDLGLELFPQASKQQKKENEQPTNDSDALFKTLFGRVGRQCEVLRIVSQIIMRSWRCNKNRQTSGHRGDVWLNFIGPDIFGKRKIAYALADTLFGSKKNFIHINLAPLDMKLVQKTVLGDLIVNGHESRPRGKTIVDQVAEELRKLPSCVVLLENFHYADPLLQRSLLQAIKDGKFSDSYGREIATNNRIFVLTSKIKENFSAISKKEKLINFPEDRIERAKGLPLQILVKEGNDGSSNKSGTNLSGEFFFNKRNRNSTDENFYHFLSLDHVKRPNKGCTLSLDLNLPAETSDIDYIGEVSLFERSDSCFEGYSSQLNKYMVKLIFDPFDYDALASKILSLIHASFSSVIELKCLLEIEPRVIDQMIAVTCLSDHEKEVEDWINHVLREGFIEVNRTYQLTAQSTVMIATLEKQNVEKQVQEVCLPSKIILN